MKRPLAYTSVVFVMVLLLLQIRDVSVFRQNPVSSTEDGQKTLLGYLQDDRITICGTITDYSVSNQYEQITTELILKDIQILPLYEDNSKENSLLSNEKNSKENSSISNEKYSKENSSLSKEKCSKDNSEYKLITKSGQSVIAYLEGEYKVIIGSQVILSGKLSFWNKASNPGEFDAEEYYGNRDVLFSVKKGKLLKVSTAENKILQNLKEFRLKQERILADNLPVGNAAIMKAMLFGNKKEMEEEIKTLYQNNGIAHVLAISGLHISLIGMSIYRLLRRLPIPGWLTLLGSELFLLLYGCMVGFSASTFRAVFMFTLFLLSKVLKRSYDMVTAMAASAVIQLLVHPGYLFDCGFQLSYAAIMGIGILLPVLEQINESLKNKWLRKIIAQFFPSLSVTLMTAPILIYHYYELSFFSILLNFIVLPLMSPLLLCGIGLLVTANLFDRFSLFVMTKLVDVFGGVGRLLFDVPGSFCMLLTKGFAFVVNLILWIYETGCRLLELLPIGRKNIAPLPVWGLLLYYSFIFVMTILVKKKRHLYQFVFTLLAFCLLLFPKKIDFSVWALDVGQGDCNVIFTEEGNCFVIDCGSTSKYNVGKKILIPFLKYHGIGRVDGVIVTHPDTDHMSGVLELLELGEEENIALNGIYIYEKGLKNEYEAWEELVTLADEQEIPVHGIGQGDILQTDSMRMECIYPLEGQSGLTGNSASVVMKIDCGEFRGLFTGDLEMEGEKQLMAEYGETSCDLLKVGHHGSSGSSSTEFLQWVNPDCAVISCGKDNVYGHPHKETLERLENEGTVILTTPECGAICIR